MQASVVALTPGAADRTSAPHRVAPQQHRAIAAGLPASAHRRCYLGRPSSLGGRHSRALSGLRRGRTAGGTRSGLGVATVVEPWWSAARLGSRELRTPTRQARCPGTGVGRAYRLAGWDLRPWRLLVRRAHPGLKWRAQDRTWWRGARPRTVREWHRRYDPRTTLAARPGRAVRCCHCPENCHGIGVIMAGPPPASALASPAARRPADDLAHDDRVGLRWRPGTPTGFVCAVAGRRQ